MSGRMLPLPVMITDQTSEIMSKPKLNVFFIRVSLVVVPLQSNRTLTKTPAYTIIKIKRPDEVTIREKAVDLGCATLRSKEINNNLQQQQATFSDY